jgi:hypothetical protein
VTRRHNPLRAKQDASYTAKEIALLFRVNIRTVRKWIANGLIPIDRHVPHLFYGRDVQAFIRKLNKPHEKLGPGEFFCVCCKGKRVPAGGLVWLTLRSERTADYTADCEGCGRKLYRRVRLSEVQDHLGTARLFHEDERAHVSRVSDAHCDALREEIVA